MNVDTSTLVVTECSLQRLAHISSADVQAGCQVSLLWCTLYKPHTSLCYTQTADVYRKLRFTLRYLLGNLADYEPARDAVPYAELPVTDRFMLSRFALLMDEVNVAYMSYQFARFYQARSSSSVGFSGVP